MKSLRHQGTIDISEIVIWYGGLMLFSKFIVINIANGGKSADLLLPFNICVLKFQILL